MNKDAQSKWVAALRSGKYEQGVSRLKTGTTFCCLGVLCDLYLKEHSKFWGSDGAYEGDPDLPEKVVTWAGLADRDPSVIFEGLNDRLTTLNDRHQLSFRKIADLIEAQL